MEKVVMLIWQFRDDPAVVTFMARFMAKVWNKLRHLCSELSAVSS